MLKERLTNAAAKANKKYQVVMYDSDSLSQSRNFSIKPLTIYMLLGGLSLVLVAVTTVLIFYVPSINRLIPGFRDNALMEEQHAMLQEQNRELEMEVEKMDTMLEALTRIASMNNPTAADQEMWAAVTPEAEDNEDPNLSQDELGKPTDNSNQSTNVPTTLPTESAPPKKIKVRPQAEFLNLFLPLEGIITNPFSLQDKTHYGIDIVADENSMIKAVADGVVIFAEYSKTTGYVLGIWHARENLVSFYKHNSKVYPQVGDYVYAGEAIAVIGNTGINSSGTHLHFELWYDNSPVNPTEFIDFK